MSLHTNLKNLIRKIEEERDKEPIGSGKDTNANLVIYGKYQMANSIVEIIKEGLRKHTEKYGQKWYG